MIDLLNVSARARANLADAHDNLAVMAQARGDHSLAAWDRCMAESYRNESARLTERAQKMERA